jgi:hypothetical protein
MTESVDQIADQLFKVIKGYGHKIILFTDDGKKTANPTEARRIFAKDIQMMVNFVVDETTNEIVVNLSKGTDIKAVQPMLSAIRNIASRHIIEFTVKTFGKSIQPKDFAYQAKTIGESNMTRHNQVEDQAEISVPGFGSWNERSLQKNMIDRAKNIAKAALDGNFRNVAHHAKILAATSKAYNDHMDIDEEINEINCWDGYKKQGTKQGTGKNINKRVNNCVPESLDDANKGNTMNKKTPSSSPYNDAMNEINQIDEISADTVNSYRDKATKERNKAKDGAEYDRGGAEKYRQFANDPVGPDPYGYGKKYRKKSNALKRNAREKEKTVAKRDRGLDMANRRPDVKETKTGMSPSARAADVEQSDREYIVQRNFKNKWKASNPGATWPGYEAAGFKRNDMNEGVGLSFSNENTWATQARTMGYTVKNAVHPSGEMTSYKTAKDKNGNIRGKFDGGSNTGSLKEAQIDELSTATMNSYKRKAKLAKTDANDTIRDLERHGHMDRLHPDRRAALRDRRKRKFGLSMVDKKLRNEGVNESSAAMEVFYDYSEDFYMLKLFINDDPVATADDYLGMGGSLVKAIEDLATSNGIAPGGMPLFSVDDNMNRDGKEGTLRNGKISWAVHEGFSGKFDGGLNTRSLKEAQINELTAKQKAMKQGAITSTTDATTGFGRPGAGDYSLPPSPSGIRKLEKDYGGNPNWQSSSQKRAARMLGKTKKKGPAGAEFDAAFKAGGQKERNYASTGDPSAMRSGKSRDWKNSVADKYGDDRAIGRSQRGPAGPLPKNKQEKEKARIEYNDWLRDRMNEDVNEGFSGWAGSARKSVNQLESARIIVKHKRSVDEEKRGARTRQIESIFIENAEGERFKFPSSNITAAKAMARHVQEGGAPFDDFGQHIYGIMEELNELKIFHRKNKRNDFFEDAAIGEEIGAHIVNLRSSLKSMSTPRGYNTQMEGFNKESADISQERIDELKDATTMSYFDEDIAASLPYVARVIESMRKRQASESHIVEFARQVMNSTSGFALSESCDDDDPDGPGAQAYKDQISEVVAWAAYLAPKVQNEALSNSLAQLEENLSAVSNQHVHMAMSAINVVKQQGTVAEANDVGHKKIDIEEQEISRVNETFSKYDIRKIFGV